MKKILTTVILLICCTCFTQTKSNITAITINSATALENQHPSEFLKEAAKLFSEDKLNDAGFLFYLGQLRYRYYIDSNPNVTETGDKALFSSLQNVIGMDLNFALGENLNNLMSIIDDVITWDSKNDFKFYSKEIDPEKHEEVLKGLKKLRTTLEESKEEIENQRSQIKK